MKKMKRQHRYIVYENRYTSPITDLRQYRTGDRSARDNRTGPFFRLFRANVQFQFRVVTSAERPIAVVVRELFRFRPISIYRCARRAMSSQKGNAARNRPQKHQNRFAFKNNLHDTNVRTKRLNAIQINHVCPRCKDILEWKIKYKKYKQLKAAKTCNKCHQKCVKEAYHTSCHQCSTALKICPKCAAPWSEWSKDFPKTTSENGGDDGDLQSDDGEDDNGSANGDVENDTSTDSRPPSSPD